MRLRRRAERPPAPGEVGQLLARLTADGTPAGERAHLLAALVRALREQGGGLRLTPGRAGLWLSGLVAEAAPHLPVRDLLTLREHHGGLSGDELAESLIVTASRVTAAIGAVGGALSSAEMMTPPTLLAVPVQLAAETLAVVVVELKLVAELHVLYGRAPQGTRAQVAVAYLASWAGRRGIEGPGRGPALSGVLGAAARQQLRSRIVRRLGRNLSTLAPFLAGALAGAEINRRETRSLGEALRGQLRR